jgi:diguanylate cyclase (GGDEF)-like protein
MERILIADGSDEVSRALRGALEAGGLSVATAATTKDALAQLHAAAHAVALVATDLPGGALDLLDAMKTDPDLAPTVVVLVSDEMEDSAVRDGLDRGASDCLRKPVDPAEGWVRTRAALRVAALQRQLREENERLTELAATDDLTGLLARRFLESHLRGLVAGATRHGRALSLVMLDVDNFKAINDTHGHSVGDQVLRAVVDRVRGRIRADDLLGRWGGDELILVLPDVGFDGAMTMAEALRQRIEAPAISAGAHPVAVTLSLGAAEWRHGESVTELVERADLAMYEAKAAGRNQVHGAH